MNFPVSGIRENNMKLFNRTILVLTIFFVFGVLNQRKRDVTQLTVHEIFCVFRLTFLIETQAQ